MNDLLLTDWRYRTLMISIIIAMIGYLIFSLWGGWHDVMRALEKIGLTGFLLALSMSLINYSLRFVRWQMYLGVMGHRVPWMPGARIYIAGFALTTTPGKAGEALRGVLLKRRKIPYSDSLAAIVSERLSDLFAVVGLTTLGFFLYPQARTVIGAGAIAVFAGFFLLSQQRLLDRLHGWSADTRSWFWVAFHHCVEILRQARRCHKPRILLAASILGLLAWAAEALAFMWILQWMEMEASFAFATFVYALAMLAGALSFMPGGLGGAEGAMLALLFFNGMPMPDAVAATVLIRLATLWFAVILGLAALLISRRERSEK